MEIPSGVPKKRNIGPLNYNKQPLDSVMLPL